MSMTPIVTLIPSANSTDKIYWLSTRSFTHCYTYIFLTSSRKKH